MVRFLGSGLLLLVLAGCASPGGGMGWRAWAGLSPAPAQFHFDWQISGDPALAPLQVFDDGRRTWLQYPAGQPAPALFVREPSGDRLLQPQREGDFLVVRGTPAHLVLRGGHLQASVQRAAGNASPATTAASLTTPMVAPVAGAENTPMIAPVVGPEAVPATAPPSASWVPPAPPARQATGPSAARVKRPAPPSVRPVALPTRSFEATPADGNIRRALARWARSAGWTFEAEHWAVDVDIPIAGSAGFGADFVPAVRGLLGATELGERPLQPCFYANQVLRVVPLAQRCDRTQAPGASS